MTVTIAPNPIAYSLSFIIPTESLSHSGSDSPPTFSRPSRTRRWRSCTRSLPDAIPGLSVSSRPPRIPSAVDSCSSFLFSSLSAWHSLRLKPCARRLASFCFALTPRALRVSAPPATFQPSRTHRSMKSCRSPRKSTPPGLGAAASLSGCPSETGRKGELKSCISTA
jgi:hypothetical protein